MIKAFGYLKRNPGLSPQEFADYYEDRSGIWALDRHAGDRLAMLDGRLDSPGPYLLLSEGAGQPQGPGHR
jgi:hypothetical protein